MSNPIHGIEIEQIEHAAIKHVDVVDYANQQADKKSAKSGKLEKAQTDREIDPDTGVPKHSVEKRRKKVNFSKFYGVPTPESVLYVDDFVDSLFCTLGPFERFSNLCQVFKATR